MLDAARERAEWTGALGRLHLDDTDIRDFRADPETFHLSGDAGCRQHRRRHGRHLPAAARLDALRGYVLLGIGHWKKQPPGELVALLRGRERELLTTPATCRRASTRASSRCTRSRLRVDEWNDVRVKVCRSIERYAREQPDRSRRAHDAGTCAVLARCLPRGAARRWASRPTSSTGPVRGSASGGTVAASLPAGVDPLDRFASSSHSASSRASRAGDIALSRNRLLEAIAVRVDVGVRAREPGVGGGFLARQPDHLGIQRRRGGRRTACGGVSSLAASASTRFCACRDQEVQVRLDFSSPRRQCRYR